MTGGLPRKALGGLVSRQERWGLTWRGWLAMVCGLVAAALLVLLNIHSFLAISKAGPATVLVVEGWISESALRAAAVQFQKEGCQTLYTTGGPTATDPDSTDESDTYAVVSASRLRRFLPGVSRERIQPVPCKAVSKDRTYTSALALKRWLNEHGVSVTSLNVATQDTHARRTRLIYEKTFGEGVAIGIISLRGSDYDPDRWWASSEGLKEVISETGAYLYARFLFTPKE
jgi:hypothetical protein